jgi:hypothetical protein
MDRQQLDQARATAVEAVRSHHNSATSIAWKQLIEVQIEQYKEDMVSATDGGARDLIAAKIQGLRELLRESNPTRSPGAPERSRTGFGRRNPV